MENERERDRARDGEGDIRLQSPEPLINDAEQSAQLITAALSSA